MKPYHHGSLRQALLDAAETVLDRDGIDGLTLRAAAREAGVSHGAPAHHFGDVHGLLTSLAEEGMRQLHDVTEAAAASTDDPVERLAAIGVAYVELARSHPAHCQVMFRTDVVDTDNPELQATGLRAYGVVERAVADLLEAEQLDVPLDDATWLCWSAMQGLVVLEPKINIINDLKSGHPISTAELVARFTRLIVDGMRGPGSSQ